MKKTAVLMIHGFMGSPKEFANLSKFLESKNNYDVFTFTLPGHSKEDGLEQFKHDLWLKKADEKLQNLIKLKYDQIYLVAHSMGGVLACDLASRYKKIEKLVLLAPAFRFMGFSNKFLKLFKRTNKLSKLYSFFRKDPLVKRMLRLPKELQLEYLNLVSSRQDVLKDIKISVLQVTGDKDKLVTKKDDRFVFNNIASKDKELYCLKDADHHALQSKYADELHNKILEFFES